MARRRKTRNAAVCRKQPLADDDRRLAGHPVEQVDDVLVDHAYAARRHRLADGPPFRRAMHPVAGVLVVLVDVHGARAERIVEAAGLTAAPLFQLRLAGDHLGWRCPGRPFLAVLDIGAARPAETVAADADTVSQ